MIENDPYNRGRYAKLSTVAVGDALETSGTYDCLLTCPPYGDIEDWGNLNQVVYDCDKWVDVCVNNFVCKRYVFVVDDKLDKYLPFIVSVIGNKGHMGRNTELILVIDRKEDGLYTIQNEKVYDL